MNIKVKKIDVAKRDRVAGAIFGFAIGDAMGATTEFMTKEQIACSFKSGKVTNIIGGGWLDLKPGEVTDDTQMTLCVIRAFVRTCGIKSREDFDHVFMKELKKEFVKWLDSNPKDVGNQCLKAIKGMKHGNMVAERNSESLGNGSLMRAMPLAVLNERYLNEIQGKMTHNNTRCSKIISKYTEIMQGFINGILFTDFSYSHRNPTGFIEDTFSNSIYWCCRDSFEEAMLGAVNDGGDADTIGAITGSLAGARFGLSGIPERWVKQLNRNVKISMTNFKKFAFNYLQI